MKTSTKRPTFAILSLILLGLSSAHAESPAPSADTSATPAPSGSAATGPKGIKASEYAWPKESSDAPKDEEWAQATEIDFMDTLTTSGWEKKSLQCRQRALREWVRLDCVPAFVPKTTFFETQRFYAALWGVAGDVSGVSAQFELAANHEIHANTIRAARTPELGQLLGKMGAVGKLIFPAKYGSATILRMDDIFWAEGYDGSGDVLVQPGIVIDISWALGEKYPAIRLNV